MRFHLTFPLSSFIPDHFHIILTLENGEKDFSKILQLIKGRFTVDYKRFHHINENISLWQRRFWEHVIRNEQDFKNHSDYIRWNPVKHGLTNGPGQRK